MNPVKLTRIKAAFDDPRRPLADGEWRALALEPLVGRQSLRAAEREGFIERHPRDFGRVPEYVRYRLIDAAPDLGDLWVE